MSGVPVSGGCCGAKFAAWLLFGMEEEALSDLFTAMIIFQLKITNEGD